MSLLALQQWCLCRCHLRGQFCTYFSSKLYLIFQLFSCGGHLIPVSWLPDLNFTVPARCPSCQVEKGRATQFPGNLISRYVEQSGQGISPSNWHNVWINQISDNTWVSSQRVSFRGEKVKRGGQYQCQSFLSLSLHIYNTQKKNYEDGCQTILTHRTKVISSFFSHCEAVELTEINLDIMWQLQL